MTRNPEGICLKTNPPHAGFVLASAADLRAKGTPTARWMIWFEGRWRRCSGPYMRREHWTYLRPLRPGEKTFPVVAGARRHRDAAMEDRVGKPVVAGNAVGSNRPPAQFQQNGSPRRRHSRVRGVTPQPLPKPVLSRSIGAPVLPPISRRPPRR